MVRLVCTQKVISRIVPHYACKSTVLERCKVSIILINTHNSIEVFVKMKQSYPQFTCVRNLCACACFHVQQCQPLPTLRQARRATRSHRRGYRGQHAPIATAPKRFSYSPQGWKKRLSFMTERRKASDPIKTTAGGSSLAIPSIVIDISLHPSPA